MTATTITTNGWTGFLGKGLAPRELQATLLAAADLSQKEIAKVMGITPKSVEKRLEVARFKLGARTMRGLVVEAFKLGLIHSCTPNPQQPQPECDGVFLA